MKVIYDNIIFSLQKTGGISVYWGELLKRISNDTNIDFSALEYKESSKNIVRSKFNLKNECLLPTNKNIPIGLIRYLNIFQKSKELIIFHSSYYRIMFGKNVRNVVTVHDFTYEKKMSGLKRFIHILQKKIALYNADAIICISNNTKLDMLEIYPELKLKYIKVIYNGFNSEDYYVLPNRLLNNQVLFVGARVGYKNFNKAVELVSYLKDTKLVIVGQNLTNNELEFLDGIIPNRYESKVNISNQELNYEYNRSICLLYLSEYEGFGIPILEAMAAGCPVIALNSSSIPEVMNENDFILEDLDKKSFIEIINKLTSNEDYLKNLIYKYSLNVQKFSWETNYNQTFELYKYLLGLNK